MTLPPTYSPNADRLLAERTEYECRLLEVVYAIIEPELFPSFPDAVIYPIDNSQPEFIAHARANIIMGDWRPGFLNAGAPLVFITTFKLLDMFLEWVLEQNGSPSTFRFQEKIKQFSQPLTFPAPIDSRPWLQDRLVGLYQTLEPLRGTIVHDKHFAASDGVIQVSTSKGKVVGPQIEISPAELRKLAVTIVSILRYIDGTWSLDPYREKWLRHNLDALVTLHGSPSLEQRQPFYPTVRLFSSNPDPSSINSTAISADLAARYPSNDCMFDLRVLIVKTGNVVDAYLFPWAVLEKGGHQWSSGIDFAAYRTAIPEDLAVKHHEGSDIG